MDPINAFLHMFTEMVAHYGAGNLIAIWACLALSIRLILDSFTIPFQPRYRYETVYGWEGEEIEKIVDLQDKGEDDE